MGAALDAERLVRAAARQVPAVAGAVAGRFWVRAAPDVLVAEWDGAVRSPALSFRAWAPVDLHVVAPLAVRQHDSSPFRGELARAPRELSVLMRGPEADGTCSAAAPGSAALALAEFPAGIAEDVRGDCGPVP